MDAVCFIRALRLGRQMAFFGCLNALWLVPLYRTANQASNPAYTTDPFVQMSIANVPSESKRFLATVVAAYITFAYVMYLTYKEYRWYAHQRHIFLAQRLARNYAIYVSGIPPLYRSSHALTNYFNKSTGHKVLEAHVTMDTHNLDKKVERREQVIQRMEHLVALEQQKGSVHSHRKYGIMEKVDSLTALKSELRQLNHEISRTIHAIRGKNHPMRSGMQRWEPSLDLSHGKRPVPRSRLINTSKDENNNNNNEINQHGTSSTLTDVTTRSSSRSTSGGGDTTGRKGPPPILPQSIAIAGYKKGMQAASSMGNQAIQTATKHSAMGIKTAKKVGTSLVNSAGAVIPLSFKEEGTPRNAGFVVFTELYTTQSSLRMIHDPHPYVMDAHAAPDPEDIIWANVGLPGEAKRTGRLASLAATAILCFWYTIPITFINSLTQVNTLKEVMPALGHLINTYPRLQMFFAQLAPLLLLIINEMILPLFLKYFSSWEGHVSSATIDASLFIKLSCFQIIQTFFVSAISGSITSELKNIMNDPKSILSFLAVSLPAQAYYFLQVLMVQTFIKLTLEILRMFPLIQASIRQRVGPRLTEKERRQKWGVFHSLEDPPEFSNAETFANWILYYVVFLVYATIAPLVSAFMLFCFILLESGYRYQLIHNYPRFHATGGKIFASFLHFLSASMLIAQLTLIGLLLLKKSIYAGPALGPLIAVTVLFIVYINSKPREVALVLPTNLCVAEDEARIDDDMRFAREVYLQPSLQHPVLMPDADTDADMKESEGPTQEVPQVS